MKWAVALEVHSVQVVETETRKEAEDAARLKLATEILDGTCREVFIMVTKRVDGMPLAQALKVTGL